MIRYFKHPFSWLLFFILFAFSKKVEATHIRAGEIIAELISCKGYTYKFTIVGYEDTGSSVDFGDGELNFGDGSEPIDLSTDRDFIVRDLLDNEIRVSTLTRTHTFPGPGEYTITFFERNRNADILNMDNSVETPFFIQTKIVIDPLLGCNNSPQLTVPPVDRGGVLKKFFHNPGAFDPDGDSLSFELVEPLKERGLTVDNYTYPDEYDILHKMGATNQAGTGNPTFELDSITGDIRWDAPNFAGEYNFSFRVVEWRKINGQWIRMGYVTRDMQVIIEDTDNEPPEIEVPQDTCVEAGTDLQALIKATDPDGDNVKIEAFGGPFEVRSSPSQLTPDPPVFQPTPASAKFTWQTNCSHVRQRSYSVQLKVSDDPEAGPSLVDFDTWNITVVGKPPEGLQANGELGRSINLNWDQYNCPPNAETIEIWRRVDSLNYEPGHCETGIPPGYTKVATVDAGVESYQDDNGGEGLAPGATYCYRLVAHFAEPEGGESYASMEACATVAADAPVITNVSIEETSPENGRITVRWTPPYDIDQSIYPPPYNYRVVRNTGFQPKAGGDTLTGQIPDTVFVDEGINTEDQIFNYKIYLYDDTGSLVDSSATASSVRLDPSPAVGEIELNWNAEVPWSNTSGQHPWHLVYRNRVDPQNPDDLVLIDSVNVTRQGFQYMDDGSFNNQELDQETTYCYFVTTRGTYGNDTIPEPLINHSQIICTQPNDTVPPCQPVALTIPNASLEDCRSFLAQKPCNFNDFENRLQWTGVPEGDCDDDVISYNIYFSETGQEDTFEKIASVRDTSYTHGPLKSFAGCYKISAVDGSGNESPLSEMICNDNCPNYELPNVITPNGDNRNDTFRPFREPGKCPRFVEHVEFQVFNRWGQPIYTYESSGENSTIIEWDGITNQGDEVPAGVYYYSIKVRFIRLNPADENKEFKGWLQVLR